MINGGEPAAGRQRPFGHVLDSQGSAADGPLHHAAAEPLVGGFVGGPFHFAVSRVIHPANVHDLLESKVRLIAQGGEHLDGSRR